jgi:hypothetical protein
MNILDLTEAAELLKMNPEVLRRKHTRPKGGQALGICR